MTGKTSRDKGKRGERELARLLQDELGSDMIQRAADQTRDGDGDLVVRPFLVECKRAQRANLTSWWGQVCQQWHRTNRADCDWPALAYRVDRRDWRFRIPLCCLRDDVGPVDDLEWTVECSAEGFCAVVREIGGNCV